MPVDRTLADGLAQALVDLYADAERAITADMARRLRAGLRAPQGTEKLGAINELRRAVQVIVARLDADLDGHVHQALTLAFARGGQAALDELARAGRLTDAQLAAVRAALPGAEAINRLVWTLTSTLRGTHLRILRWPLDAYREVIAATLPQTLLGTTTRLAAAQHAWDRLLDRGITGFVDRSGRRWQLASYVEMAARTGTAQAAVQGHLDRLGTAGIDLVIVSDAPQECARCRPWEGKVLHRGQRTEQVEHATRVGITVDVRVAGSVTEAVAAGLMHPNCRHSLSAFTPGITELPRRGATADPEGDKARQRLRELERRVRREKTKAAAALDPAAARVHAAKVRQLQAQIRDHIDTAPTTLRRRREREQIGTAR
jgi:hypothetical protein